MCSACIERSYFFVFNVLKSSFLDPKLTSNKKKKNQCLNFEIWFKNVMIWIL